MMAERDRAGIALAGLFGLMHALWVIAVAAGVGDTLLGVLEQWHFLASGYSTTPFDAATALLGIVGAAAFGYVTGWVFAYLYEITERL